MGAPLDAGLRMAAAVLARLLGIGWQLQQPVLWPPAAYAAQGAAALPLLGAWRVLAARAPHGALGCLLLALVLLGHGCIGWRAGLRLADNLPAALEGVDLQLTGVVVRLPQPGVQGTRFVFDIEQAARDGQAVAVPQRVSLGWYRNADGASLMTEAAPDLRAGQCWTLTARLRQPHGSLNPHGFDLELWLFEQGIRASGTVRTGEGALNRKLADDAGHPVEGMRQSIRDAMLLRIGDAQAAGVLAALAVGDQAAIDRDDWDLFRHTGAAHLMSISDVTMFAWLAGLLIGLLWRRSDRLMLALPTPVAARWGGVLAAAAYALLAGWGVPAQRTLWMLVTVAVLRSSGLRWPPLLVLLAAAGVVTLIDPWALMQPGFWLSFGAVALLMLGEPALADAPRAAAGRWTLLRAQLRAALRTQAVASIGLAPLSLVFFQQVSIIGLAANLVAIPLVTLAIVPLALARAGVLLPPLWAVASLLVQGLVALLGWMAAWTLGLWNAAAAPPWGVASWLLGGVLLLLPLPLRLRLLGLPLLPLLAPPIERPADRAFAMVVADVGQGTAVLLHTRRHLVFCDAGPCYGEQADAGQRMLLPLLGARSETHIDLLMLSHRDTDHVGGADSLLAATEVRRLSSSLPPEHPLLATGLVHRRCAAGQSWVWDGVTFELLHPTVEGYATARKPNALSCVLRMQARSGGSMLLTGDIEAAQEAALVSRHGASLRSQVLLVPHHGSRTSSTEAFVQAVAPGTALVQAAYRNRFGHHAPQVEGRYRDWGVELLRSDRCGAWSWSSDGASRCERQSAARYWHHRPDADALPAP